MKVFISKYRDHWLSPYTIMEFLARKELDYEDPVVDKWADRLSPFCEGLRKTLDFIFPRIEYVKIDKADTWNMDHTLALITLPMLEQLKKTKQGAPNVDDEDVPVGLKSTSAPPKENEWDTDENWHKRWNYVLNEMIFAFKLTLTENWEDQLISGVADYQSKPCAWDSDGKATLYQMIEGPNHTYKMDYERRERILKRQANGFRLFGRYYSALWD